MSFATPRMTSGAVQHTTQVTPLSLRIADKGVNKDVVDFAGAVSVQAPQAAVEVQAQITPVAQDKSIDLQSSLLLAAEKQAQDLRSHIAAPQTSWQSCPTQDTDMVVLKKEFEGMKVNDQAPSFVTWIEQNNDRMQISACLLYTSPSPRDGLLSRMPSSA